MIEVSDVTFVYPNGVVALEDVTFNVEKGEKVVILGENGCGKTTLLLCIAGLLYPRRGRIVVDGVTVKKENEDIIRRKVGLVFQNPDDQVFLPKVYDDVAFALRNMGLDEDEVRKKVSWSLKAMGIEELAERNPNTLSLGQKKKVAIAGVLAMNPEILLIDEPTAGLDHRGVLEIYNVLEELNNDGKTIVVTTHDVEFAESWADKVVIMKGGRVLMIGDSGVLDELERFGMRKPIKRTIFSELGVNLAGAMVRLTQNAKFGYGVDSVIPEIDLDLILLRGLNKPVDVRVSERLMARFLEFVNKKNAVVVEGVHEDDERRSDRNSLCKA